MYVTQPEVKPGCVLRRSNWSVLEGRKLVDDTQARALTPLLQHFRARLRLHLRVYRSTRRACAPTRDALRVACARMQMPDARYPHCR